MAANMGNAGNGRGDARFVTQFRKTELCKFYSQGWCVKGDRCEYAHGADEVQTAPDLKKTSLCKDFMKHSCRLPSEKCPFAHGMRELRATPAYMERPLQRARREEDRGGMETPERARREEDRGGMETPGQTPTQSPAHSAACSPALAPCCVVWTGTPVVSFGMAPQQVVYSFFCASPSMFSTERVPEGFGQTASDPSMVEGMPHMDTVGSSDSSSSSTPEEEEDAPGSISATQPDPSGSMGELRVAPPSVGSSSSWTCQAVEATRGHESLPEEFCSNFAAAIVMQHQGSFDCEPVEALLTKAMPECYED